MKPLHRLTKFERARWAVAHTYHRNGQNARCPYCWQQRWRAQPDARKTPR